MRILVVDDYAPFCTSLALLLRNDHEVATASGGRAAVELLGRDAAFDALLVDVNMPGVSGLDVYEFLQDAAPSAAAKVIFMTGGSVSPAVSEALARLANRNLEKPFGEREIVDALAAMGSAR